MTAHITNSRNVAAQSDPKTRTNFRCQDGAAFFLYLLSIDSDKNVSFGQVELTPDFDRSTACSFVGYRLDIANNSHTSLTTLGQQTQAKYMHIEDWNSTYYVAIVFWLPQRKKNLVERRLFASKSRFTVLEILVLFGGIVASKNIVAVRKPAESRNYFQVIQRVLIRTVARII